MMSKEITDNLATALRVLYVKFEEGVACYEDGDTESAHIGYAVQLKDWEEDQIIDALNAYESELLMSIFGRKNGKKTIR